MVRQADSLYADANSVYTYQDQKMASYVLLSLGTINSIDAKTGLASVRVYVNDPIRVYEEYDGVEVLSTGINVSAEGNLCLVFAPRTPMLWDKKKDELVLVNSGRPYDTLALKAIPITRPASLLDYGIETIGQDSSLYTPFGKIIASPEGLKLAYNKEKVKSGIGIDAEGIPYMFSGFVWVKMGEDEEDKLTLHAENDTVTTEAEFSDKGAQVIVKKTPETEEEEEIDYHKLELKDDGTLEVSAFGEQGTQVSTIVLSPDGKNEFTIKTNDPTKRLILSISTDAQGTLTIKQPDESGALKNEVVLDSTGRSIKVTDMNQNKVEMSATGIKLTDMSQHSVTMAATGISLQGTTGLVEIQ